MLCITIPTIIAAFACLSFVSAAPEFKSSFTASKVVQDLLVDRSRRDANDGGGSASSSSSTAAPTTTEASGSSSAASKDGDGGGGGLFGTLGSLLGSLPLIGGSLKSLMDWLGKLL